MGCIADLFGDAPLFYVSLVLLVKKVIHNALS